MAICFFHRLHLSLAEDVTPSGYGSICCVNHKFFAISHIGHHKLITHIHYMYIVIYHAYYILALGASQLEGNTLYTFLWRLVN